MALPSPHHKSSTLEWLSPSLWGAAEHLQMCSCPSVRPQPLERERTGGRLEPEGKERQDKVIQLLWLWPWMRNGLSLLHADVTSCNLASPDAGSAPGPWSRQVVPPALALPRCWGGSNRVCPDTPEYMSLSLKEKGSLVLLCPLQQCPAAGQEASCYPGSPGGDLIRA